MDTGPSKFEWIRTIPCTPTGFGLTVNVPEGALSWKREETTSAL